MTKYRATTTIHRNAKEIAKAIFIGTTDDYFRPAIVKYVSNIIRRDMADWILTYQMNDFILNALYDVLPLWEEDFYDGYEIECDPVFNLVITIRLDEM